MSITEQINILEAKYNLNAIEVDGFHPWTYTRFSIALDMGLNSLAVSKSAWTVVKSLASSFKKLFVLLSKKACSPQVKVDILFLCGGRRSYCNGIYENIYTDDIADLYPNSVTLEAPHQLMHLSPAKTKNLLYCGRVTVVSYLKFIITKQLLKHKYKQVYWQIYSLFEKPLSELVESNDINITRCISKMAENYFLYKYVHKKLKKLLCYISPKIIIEEEYYNIYNMAINEIAKDLGIPTIELQHGVIGKEHIAYNYPDGEQIKQFPDMVFLFSDYWKDNASYPIEKDKLVSTGFPYFDRQVDYYKSKVDSHNEKCLVFISSMIKGFEELAVETHDIIKHKGWRLIFKLHPLEYRNWRENYPLLSNSSIEVIDTNDRSLYEIFASCSALVCVFSTSIYEGLGFGLPVFIYDCPDTKAIEDLISNKVVSKVKDCENLCAELETLSNQNTSTKEYLWKSGALENMKMEIEKVLASAPQGKHY